MADALSRKAQPMSSVTLASFLKETTLVFPPVRDAAYYRTITDPVMSGRDLKFPLHHRNTRVGRSFRESFGRSGCSQSILGFSICFAFAGVWSSTNCTCWMLRAHFCTGVPECVMVFTCPSCACQILLLVSRHWPMGRNPREHAWKVWKCLCLRHLGTCTRYAHLVVSVMQKLFESTETLMLLRAPCTQHLNCCWTRQFT